MKKSLVTSRKIRKTDILALEGEIIAGTFEYVYRFIKRHSS